MRKRKYKALPVSEQAYFELSAKYRFPVEELRRMAAELQMARPKLEMHLIYLSVEAKKKALREKSVESNGQLTE